MQVPLVVYYATGVSENLKGQHIYHTPLSVSPRIKKKRGGGVEAVYALAYTLLAYNTILCCTNMVVLRPFWGNTGSILKQFNCRVVISQQLCAIPYEF